MSWSCLLLYKFDESLHIHRRIPGIILPRKPDPIGFLLNHLFFFALGLGLISTTPNKQY